MFYLSMPARTHGKSRTKIYIIDNGRTLCKDCHRKVPVIKYQPNTLS